MVANPLYSSDEDGSSSDDDGIIVVSDKPVPRHAAAAADDVIDISSSDSESPVEGEHCPKTKVLSSSAAPPRRRTVAAASSTGPKRTKQRSFYVEDFGSDEDESSLSDSSVEVLLEDNGLCWNVTESKVAELRLA